MAKNPDFRKAVGKSLQSKRKSAGYKSAKAFAEFIGIETSAYTEYEQGRRSFTYEQAWEFADALNCTLDSLGGRVPPVETYNDERQEMLNHNYEALTEDGKDAALGAVRGIRASESARAGEEGPAATKERIG